MTLYSALLKNLCTDLDFFPFFNSFLHREFDNFKKILFAQWIAKYKRILRELQIYASLSVDCVEVVDLIYSVTKKNMKMAKNHFYQDYHVITKYEKFAFYRCRAKVNIEDATISFCPATAVDVNK